MEKTDILRKPLTAAQRAKLRSLAAARQAIIQIGKDGVGANTVVTLDAALESRELVKVTVLKTCPTDVRETAEALAAATSSEVVTTIGRKAVFYRESAENKQIEL